jgi:uncharacterized protein
MPRRESYTAGTPNWVDLQTADVATALTFYGAFFGWTYREERDGQGAPVLVAHKGDGIVASISPLPPGADESASIAIWQTYLAVDNVDTAVARTITGGGAVVSPPTEVGDAGVCAFVKDSNGAAVGLWQARQRIGATLVNEPGAVIWNELSVDDLESAIVFYDHVLGLTGEISDPGSGPYVTFKSKSDPVAGACSRGGSGAPCHWHVYFAVDDAARAAARAVELGGEVLAGPIETAIGPMASLRDAVGAMFSVFQVPADPA